MNTNNLLRRFLVGCWRYYKRTLYRKNNVAIDYGAEFNPQTQIGKYVRIHHHTNIKESIIGNYTYIQNNCVLEKCKIGSFCSIGDNVKVLSATHPTKDFVSTCPVFFSTARQCLTTFTDKDLFDEYHRVQGFGAIIGNDVWVGSSVIILGGVRVGHGAIIAAGTVVNKDVPPYAIVAGVPARIIRYRFNDEQIKKILKDPWWKKSEEWLREHVKDFANIQQYIENNNYE